MVAVEGLRAHQAGVARSVEGVLNKERGIERPKMASPKRAFDPE